MSRKRRRTCGPPVTSSTSDGEKTTAPSLPRAAEMRRVSLPSTDTFFFLRLLSKPAETVAGPSPSTMPFRWNASSGKAASSPSPAPRKERKLSR